jgi:hypothetical protein
MKIMKYLIKIKHSNKVFFLVTVIEIFIILSLILIIYQKIEFSNRSKLAAIAPIKSDNYNYSVRGSLKYFYEPKPNSQRTDTVDWLNYKTTYELNNEGFNSSVDYSIDKPTGTFRILTIGDSHTFGLYVDPSKNYPKQLESNLNGRGCTKNNFEVINMGVPGYDLDYSIERFKSKGLKYSPDLVIWLIKPDDVFQINELMKGRSDQIRKAMQSSGELKKYEQQGEYFPNVRIAQKQLEEEIGRDNMLEIARKKIWDLRSIYKGKLLFLSYYKFSVLNKSFFLPFLNQPLTYYYDDLPLVDDLGYKLPDGHPNELGYKYIADSISGYMFLNNIIDCNSLY